MKNNSDILIIGAGLTGLSLAHFLKKNGLKCTVIEKSDRPGGVINTHSENGFVYESGPNTGVLSSIELVTLFSDLKDKVTLETANKESNKRYILINGRWEALPSGLISAVTTPLFSFKDKFRILAEPFRKPGKDPDETVARLVVRRLGRTYLDYAVDPFISGIYAGDPASLVTRYALPKLYALEHDYGSFIRGAVVKAGKKKSDDDRKVTREVFSAAGGLGNLTLAMAGETGNENIIYGAEGLTVMPAGNLYQVAFTDRDGKKHEQTFHYVVTTTGSYTLRSMLPFLDGSDLVPFNELKYAPVVQVATGYKSWTGMKLDAFGALVPAKEKRDILGILFPSAIFKGRAPEKGALLSVFTGGIKNPDMIHMTDNEIYDVVLREIARTLSCDKVPELLKIFRYEHAIPQYDVSTGRRLEAISRIEKLYPRLILAGNIRDGIGMSDRVKQAKNVADRIKTGLS